MDNQYHNIERELLKKINHFAQKAKTEGLTEEEIIERADLRKKYIENFKGKFKDEILDNIYIVEKDGTKKKLT